MGCDIHIVLERREEGSSEWVGVYCTDDWIGRRPLIANRDYAFFAEVAQVRGHSDTGKYPKNVPKDISRLAWLSYMRSPTDHHSPSHMTVEEFTAAWFRANEKDGFRAPPGTTGAPRKEFAANDLLGVDGYPENVEHRVVFWFDN